MEARTVDFAKEKLRRIGVEFDCLPKFAGSFVWASLSMEGGLDMCEVRALQSAVCIADDGIAFLSTAMFCCFFI
jgi:hypothetical protein